jgi:cytochrome c peroxidase
VAESQLVGTALLRDFGWGRRLAAGTVCLLLAVAAPPRATAAETPSALAALGRSIFFDPTLSASGRLSCASCHDPSHAYGPPNARAVQLGGAAMDRQGPRAVPSLRYVLNRTPAWSKQYVSNPVERLLEPDEAPSGGFGWDGRFNNLRDQAAFPLLSPDEMANADATQVAARLRHAPYADSFRLLFGQNIFDDPQAAYARALAALERFELEDASFHPYTSRYDAYLDGTVKLTTQEQHGLALFDDPANGNCASCHLDKKGADGSHPLFTDYQFEALGVPRNDKLAANADREHFDMGACGPLRRDQAQQRQYCGLFKTPTLRNVAIRRVFFHNGRFHDLKAALRFYVRRDTDPARWYPLTVDGKADKFNDLPPALRGNVDVIDEPLTRHEGAAAAWSDADIDDVIAFLQTLNDRDAVTAAGD